MKLTTGNHFFPHPVLGNRSDIDSSFSLNLNPVKKNSTSIHIGGTISLSNKTIFEMLKRQTATCLLHIESPMTCFRKITKVGKWEKNITEFSIELDLKDLRGNIDINLFCVSNIEQNNYSPEGLSSQYEDAKFIISKGSVLSFAKQKSFSLPDDNTKSSGGSLFILRPNKDETLKMDFSNDGGQSIAILVPKSAFATLNTIVKGGDVYFNGILVNTFFLPCLVEALKIYKEEQSGFPWCQKLEESLADQDIAISPGSNLEFDDRMEIAQKVLNKAFPIKEIITKYRCL